MFRITAYDRDGRQVAVVDADGGEVTIGRETDRRLTLPSPSVSRRHARIVLDGAQPFIADEGSANGVLVNGARIGGPTALVPGVRVDIAEYWLDFAIAGEQPSAPTPGPIAAAPPPPPRLRAQGGPFAGRMFDIPSGRVSIGRAIDNDLVFDDPSLSRKHAIAHTAGPDRIELQDLGSSNGTWVKGRKIDSIVASVGDTVRFGDLTFTIEGDGALEPAAAEYESSGAARHAGWLVYGGIGAAVLVIAAVGTVLLLRKPARPSGATDTLASIPDEVERQLKLGKDRLADKQFDSAIAAFARTLELDPTNGEARRLKLLATSEPDNDKLARTIAAKASMGGRSDLEAAVRMIGQLPHDSVFRDATAQKLAAKLVSFGDAQCKTKKFADCAWAICKAMDVAPPAARDSLIPAAVETEMHDAEKKAARDRGFAPCKMK